MVSEVMAVSEVSGVLGIDVSKQTLDAALIMANELNRKPRHKVFANTPAGHQQLLQWLAHNGAVQVHACLESTGTYGQALAQTLHQAHHNVSVVNPSLIRAFGQSQLSRTKTDKADSQLIARFCQMNHPPLWSPPTPEVAALQGLVRPLESLDEMRVDEMRVMEENRLEALAASLWCEEVEASLQEHIAYLHAQLEKTPQQIKDHIDQNPTLKTQRDLLTSIPGIGQATASLLHGVFVTRRLCYWLRSRCLSSKALDKSLPLRVWCRASVSQALRCADIHTYAKRVHRVCVKADTFPLSRPWVSIP